MIKAYLISLVLYVSYILWFKYIYMTFHYGDYENYLSSRQPTYETKKIGHHLAIFGLVTITMVVWTIVTLIGYIVSLP